MPESPLSRLACLLVTPPDCTFLDAWVAYDALIRRKAVHLQFPVTEVDDQNQGMLQAGRRFWSVEPETDDEIGVGSTTLLYPSLSPRRPQPSGKLDWAMDGNVKGWKKTQKLQNCIPNCLLNSYDPVLGGDGTWGGNTLAMTDKWFIRIGIEECLKRYFVHGKVSQVCKIHVDDLRDSYVCASAIHILVSYLEILALEFT
mmetsp:Transcript_1934/g.3622  ORF Transcript_1934/g.3622 Transcript_1934/m.3622 type:complete len:200 (-) Transcript_1934:126-725(-)